MNTAVRLAVSNHQVKMTVALTALDCPACGVIFAVPELLNEQHRDKGTSFYCPNGHPMSYTASTVDRLRTQLKDAERDRDWYKDAERRAADDAAAVKRSLTATRGQVTKLRKRVVAGACPFGCRRHFADLERHVASKHEGQTLEAEAEPA